MTDRRVAVPRSAAHRDAIRAPLAAHLAELWQHRELLLSLVLRDLKARYRGTALGFLWTFLNPLLLIATYSLVFSVFMRIEMPHYEAFLLTGLLPWLWFSSSLTMGAVSVIEGGSLLRR